jgi:hypothetical protein
MLGSHLAAADLKVGIRYGAIDKQTGRLGEVERLQEEDSA